MGIGDIEERLYNFVGTLSNSSKELTDDVRNRACSLVGDVKQIITESYDTLGDKYDYVDATIRNTRRNSRRGLGGGFSSYNEPFNSVNI